MSDFLKKHTRQPKIFIDLPSNGQFYDNTVLQDMQTTQIPVYGMTAMDEIMLKTPDALFTGEATVRVIQSCIPTILNPWRLIGYDMDYVLIAIRMASYSDALPLETTCANCETKNTNEIKLSYLLDSFSTYKSHESFMLNELTVNLAPIDYKTHTGFQQEQYTLERQVAQIQVGGKEQNLEKEKMLQELLNQMTNIQLRLSVAYIDNITDGTDKEADSKKILEFISNNDAKFYKDLQVKINDISQSWQLPTFDVDCQECDNKYKAKINLDYSSFFGNSSFNSRNLISSN